MDAVIGNTSRSGNLSTLHAWEQIRFAQPSESSLYSSGQ